MISIGSFSFPEDKTFYEVKMIEAKSKVRKEIHITSLLDGSNGIPFHESMARLQASVEAYDRGQARLSINDGRYYEGRRRLLEIVPDVQRRLAFVKFITLTNDRFERGIAFHQIDHDIFYGYLQLSVWQQGNWQSPPKISILPDEDITELSIQNGSHEFQLVHHFQAEEPIVIDSQERSVSAGDEKIFLNSGIEFPMLDAGCNALNFFLSPGTVNAALSVQYQDVWV